MIWGGLQDRFSEVPDDDDDDDLTNFLDDTGDQEKQRRSPLSSSFMSWRARSYLEERKANTRVKWLSVGYQFHHSEGTASTDPVSSDLSSSDTSQQPRFSWGWVFREPSIIL